MTLRVIEGGRQQARAARKAADFNAKVGAKIRAWRIECGLSLADVGVRMGMNATTIMRYESGSAPLTVVKAAAICAELGHEITELFD